MYTYDAAGNKLKKVTTEGATITTTLYLGSFNYINDILQFASHEEGRIRPKTLGNTANGFAYDYFIKDHLGNIRMVLTDELQTSNYPAATMEPATIANESLYYANLTQTKTTSLPVGYPANTPAGNTTVAKVNGSGVAGTYKVGPAITLKVMAGDKINLTVNSFWKGTAPGVPASPLTDLVAAMTNSFAGVAGGKNTAAEITASGLLTPNTQQFLNSQSGFTTTKPKAFVNWVLFDEQFKYVAGSSSFEQVGSSGTYTTHTKTNLPINKNGYLYIYVSNETPNIDVFFDNLQVTHVKGALREETHYYPFGLPMAGISSKAAGITPNKYKYNGIEYNSDFDINIGETFFRSHDPQLGRWLQIDPKADKFFDLTPYMAMGNNPVTIIDPRGDEIPITVYDENGKKVKSKNVTDAQVATVVSMYQKEYGIAVTYDKKNGTLVYAGEAETDATVSADAKDVMMKQLAKGEISENKIAIGTGLAVNGKTGKASFGNASAGKNEAMTPAVTLGKTSYFDIGLVNSDLSMNDKSFKFSTFGNATDGRTANFARIFEHDFIGHNVMGINNDGPRSGWSSSPGPVEALMNTYRQQMGLGHVQSLNYQTNNPGESRVLKYFGDPSTGKTNAILEINPNLPR